MKKIRLAGIGCGGRTRTYMELAATMPQCYELVAAADPNAERLEMTRKLSGNPAFRTFISDAALLAAPKLADVMIIGTQDHYHVEPCIAAMQKGYDILLEKPVATTLRETIALEEKARQLGRKVLVCHVLRYTPFYSTVKQIIASGALGDIVTINASEGVGPFHQAHSFVRGHWAVTSKCTPMIIAKSCHDMDILAWLTDDDCTRISSFGSLSHFNRANAPQDAPDRCTEGCPVGDTCPYNAMHYLGKHKGWLQWVYDRALTASREESIAWLSTSPWGRCVYRCDNDAVDHQTVNCQFARGATATFTMSAFGHGRDLEILGTRATLHGGHFTLHNAGADIVVHDHASGHKTRYNLTVAEGGYDHHGGGDMGLVQSLYHEMLKENPADMRSSLHRSVQSHLMGFAAEESRLAGTTIDLAEYRKKFSAPLKSS